MRTRIVAWVLKRLTKDERKCPDMIPRSGEKAQKVNCYSVIVLDPAGEFRLLVDSLEAGEVKGKGWNAAQKRFDEDDSLPLSEIGFSSILVGHFFREFEFRYQGLFHLFLRGFSGVDYLYAWFFRARRHLVRFQRLHVKEQMDLLRLLIHDHVQNDVSSFSVYSVMTLVHTNLWAIHPKKEVLRRQYKLMLDSFVAAGELKHSSTSSLDYELTGKAYGTLTEYERVERQHKDRIALARAQTWLTAALVLASLLTAIPILTRSIT